MTGPLHRGLVEAAFLAVATMALLAIGRNTFPIYVGHVIVLFGGIFGVCLLKVWGQSLDPWQAGFGAFVFCSCFALFARIIEPVERWWKRRFSLSSPGSSGAPPPR